MVDILLIAAVVSFVAGLALTNVVFVLTRRPLRQGKEMARSHRLAMWLAVFLAGGGLILGAAVIALG